MKRVPQAITHDINKQCDETNTYIQIKGYRLQKEDIAYLLQTQKEACGFYAMIEFSSSIIFQLAKVFRDSPYLSYDRYVPLLHDIIYVYMERLWLEQSFCLHFSTSDIAAFIERYEIQKDVKVDMLGVNVCEILLTQHLFSMLLASSSRLLLTQHECTYIEHMLQNIHIDDTFVTSIFTKALDNFPASIQLYLQTYAESFKELLQVMVPQQSISEWMIVPQEKLTTDVQLTPPCDPKVFQKLLSDIYNTETIDGKMELIIQTPLGLYDYLDLLNDSIFIEEELPVFFAKLDIFQIALLFYVQNQELFRFHQIPTLSEEELLNLDIHELWEPSFYKYINNLSAKQKKALHDAFQAIKTIDLSS